MTKSNDSSNGGASRKQWGAGLSQIEFMEKDTVLVVDNDDRIIGNANKAESHVFSTTNPHGILHRAFSVFLFDTTTNRLLLQQRASSKITFPNVWTNTCCSHPLFGMVPDEVDQPQDIANGSIPGVKNAAVRKLGHELGIKPDDIELSHMKFLTRLHYWAADTVTHGPDSRWGEHEIDHVLIWAVPDAEKKIQLQPHPDEVQDVKFVSPQELNAMFDDPNLLISPWFKLIAQRWLLSSSSVTDDATGGSNWWRDLEETMKTNRHCDYTNIHCFDPPREHWGGGGNAQPLFLTKKAAAGADGGTAATDPSKKQGAYGKIPIHKESKLAQLVRFDEVFSALTLLYVSPLKSNLDSAHVQQHFAGMLDEVHFCHDMLVNVSRSFAAVILQLPAVLLVDILVFYLVLRALDTIEDDTTAFASHEEKINHLRNFHKNALGSSSQSGNWTMDGVGQGDERKLLQEFPRVHKVYAALPDNSKRIITDITQRMATGMAEFVLKDLGQGTVDVDQYNRYCHFVAGLVGEGLSRLFCSSGLEKPTFASELYLSDQMGLFLQKTNIIRDYLEDYVDKRAFWPQSIWKKYSQTGELGYFANQDDPLVREKSLQCLNELVTDALELVPDCLTYMSKLQCQEIFRFCAIPQVMAIATLAKCYANSNVFTGVVKIRKGLSCKLILKTNSLDELHEVFYDFAKTIGQEALKERKTGVLDPNYSRTLRVCSAICDLTCDAAKRRKHAQLIRTAVTAAIVALPTAACLIMADDNAPISSILTSCWNKPLKHGLIQAGLAVAAGLLYVYGPWWYLSSPSSSKIGGSKDGSSASSSFHQLKRAELLEKKAA